jgi:hypothetical protein
MKMFTSILLLYPYPLGRGLSYGSTSSSADASVVKEMRAIASNPVSPNHTITEMKELGASALSAASV